MITLAEVRDWLKTFQIAENYYIGKLDNKKDKSIGVYSLNQKSPPVIAIGGLDSTTFNRKSVSVLIHWNKNADETEKAAYSLFERLLEQTHFYIGGTLVFYLKLNVSEPIDAATDEKGVYERVIEFDLYYKRSEINV